MTKNRKCFLIVGLILTGLLLTSGGLCFAQTTGQTTDQSAGQTTDQSAGQTTDQSAGQTTDQSAGQTTDQSAGQATDQSAGQATNQTTEDQTTILKPIKPTVETGQSEIWQDIAADPCLQICADEQTRCLTGVDISCQAAGDACVSEGREITGTDCKREYVECYEKGSNERCLPNYQICVQKCVNKQKPESIEQPTGLKPLEPKLVELPIVKPTEPTLSPIDWCFKKYTAAGYSPEEAKKFCVIPRPEATPGIKNPCDELKILESTYEELLKKETYLRELIASGYAEQTIVEDLSREIEFLKKKLEQMRFACQQGKPITESPCVRLSKLQTIYSQLSQKFSVITDAKESLVLKKEIDKIVEEIIGLKKRCRGTSLQTEKAESLLEIEKIYETKVEEVGESTKEEEITEEEAVEEIKKIDEEKKKTIEDFAKKVKELDLKKTKLIKKMRISKQGILLEDISAPAMPVEVEIKGRPLQVNPSIKGLSIEEGGVKAEGNVELEYKEGDLVGAKSGKSIKILPSEAIEKIKEEIKEEIKEIDLKDEKTLKYVAKTEKEAKLFWFIPVVVPINYEIDTETGVSKVKRPWWSFFAK